MTRFLGKVVLVTGSSHGIGRAIAERFVLEGARVIGVDLNEPSEQSSSIEFVKCDISKEDQVSLLPSKVGPILHCLVNNAGIFKEAPIDSTNSLNIFDQIITINLRGPYLLTRTLLPSLRGAESASIVNIASTRAFMSEPNTEAYAASKGGLVALTHALSISLGPKIRVNSVSPGWINVNHQPLSLEDKAQHPIGRVGVPEDIAAACAFLGSDDSSFMTGENITIDGGMSKKMIYC